MYLERTIERHVHAAAGEFPVVVVTGPRQAGKTTMLRRVFGGNAGYVSLDVPDVRAAAIADPRSFLAAWRPPVILDEVQQAPELLPYLRAAVDEDRELPGRYILSGSQNLLLLQRVTETLAGRAAILRLLPLSMRESVGMPHAPLPWEQPPRPDRPASINPSCAYGGLWDRLVRGFYPEMVAHPSRSASRWYASYVQTYLERDVRAVRQVGDLSAFQAFLRSLAARTSQQLNLSEVGRDVGVPAATCRTWLSVLEATHQIAVVRPFFANLGKRLVKSPKVYFMDVGMVCHLCGITSSRQAADGPMAGALFETAVVVEAIKSAHHRFTEPRQYFWRTAEGREVDMVLETADGLTPVEVKVGATPRPAMASGIEAFRREYGSQATRGFVVHTGDTVLPLGPHALAIPFGWMGGDDAPANPPLS